MERLQTARYRLKNAMGRLQSALYGLQIATPKLQPASCTLLGRDWKL